MKIIGTEKEIDEVINAMLKSNLNYEFTSNIDDNGIIGHYQGIPIFFEVEGRSGTEKTEEEKMKTKFNIGEEIDLKIKGIVRRISIDERGACYTIIVKDSHGRESDLYIDENALETVNQN